MTNTAIFTARMDGANTSFSAPGGIPLLNAVEQAGLPGLKLESPCRNGTCRTCMCRLLDGEVAYRIEWPGLSLEEKRARFILPCVAYPLTDVVIQCMS